MNIDSINRPDRDGSSHLASRAILVEPRPGITRMDIYAYDTISVYTSGDEPGYSGAFQGSGYDGRILAEEPPHRPGVRVNVSDHKGRQIKAILATLGGVPSRPRAGCAYDFATWKDRDDALEAIRSRFGWTCVDPS